MRSAGFHGVAICVSSTPRSCPIVSGNTMRLHMIAEKMTIFYVEPSRCRASSLPSGSTPMASRNANLEQPYDSNIRTTAATLAAMIEGPNRSGGRIRWLRASTCK